MKYCFKIISILVLVLFFSCQEPKKTFHNESFVVKDSLSSDVHCFKQDDENGNVKNVDSLEIVESLGYEHGYDKGFDDAGSEIYSDKPEGVSLDDRYQNLYLEAFKRGYEDGWVEWKNRNDVIDY